MSLSHFKRRWHLPTISKWCAILLRFPAFMITTTFLLFCALGASMVVCSAFYVSSLSLRVVALFVSKCKQVNKSNQILHKEMAKLPVLENRPMTLLLQWLFMPSMKRLCCLINRGQLHKVLELHCLDVVTPHFDDLLKTRGIHADSKIPSVEDVL